jgi:alpha-tubulin suppressor-like RCC1 family protein
VRTISRLIRRAIRISLSWLMLANAAAFVSAQTPTLLDSPVTQVATGDFHTCALTTEGAVQCWGNNGDGQLGNNSLTNSPVPVTVTGLASGVVAITAGAFHTCALTMTGEMKCWGYNNYGALGNNTTTNSAVPVVVTGLASSVAAIAAGEQHTCALTTAGSVQCWGYNGSGQLGNNTTVSSSVPVTVTGLATGVTAVTAGANHACARVAANAAKCWGANNFGQLGNNSLTNSTVPVAVSGLASGVTAIASGSVHTCAVDMVGALQCWGYNGSGQLGNNTTVSSSVPVTVTGLATGVTAVTAGQLHTCALTMAGAMKCWGYNYYGQLGNNSTTDSPVPVATTNLSTGVAGMAAGGSHTCALTATGSVRCWGQNAEGQLGWSMSTILTARRQLSWPMEAGNEWNGLLS